MSDLSFPTFLAPGLGPDDYIRIGYIYDLYDGDTVYYHAKLGYGVWAAFQIGRLLDVQAPEIRPLKSRTEGIASKEFLRGMFDNYALNRHLGPSPYGHKFKIRSVKAKNKHFEEDVLAKKGKYGRWLIEVIGADNDGQPVNLNDMMLKSGLAVPYSV